MFRELLLTTPGAVDVPALGLTPLPGRAAVWMHRTGVTDSGLHLPPSGSMAPDVGYLMSEALGLPIGTPVALAPDAGAWFDHEGGEYRLLGVDRPLEDAILMYWDGAWQPLGKWTLVEMQAHGMFDLRTDVGQTPDGQFVVGGERYFVPALGKDLVAEVYAEVV